jgi:hypothetical protein
MTSESLYNILETARFDGSSPRSHVILRYHASSVETSLLGEALGSSDEIRQAKSEGYQAV